MSSVFIDPVRLDHSVDVVRHSVNSSDKLFPHAGVDLGKKRRKQSENGVDHEVGHDDECDSEQPGTDGYDDASASNKRQKTLAMVLTVSCEKCKERKVKCDRAQPCCGWCVRNGQECEYRERKKPGLRAGYGRELETRLDRLESLLASHDQLIRQLLAASPQASTLHSESISSHGHALRENTISNTASLPSVIAETRLPLYDVASGPSLHASPATYRTPSTKDLIPGDTPMVTTQSPAQDPGHYILTNSSALASHVANTLPNTLQTTMQTTPDQDLPPYDLLYALTDLYFKHVNTWCPILHRRTTLDSLFGSRPLSEADRILLCAIVATTLRFSEDTRLTPDAKHRFHSLCKQRVLLYGLENSSVTALQALVILALDIVGTSNGPPGWNLLALITRSAVQLGLSVETTSASVAPTYPSIYTLRAVALPDAETFIEDESRRRLFWMIYLLDRYATLSTAFEFALDEKEIDRRLPCRDDFFLRNQRVQTRWFRANDTRDRLLDEGENLGSFSFYIEIIEILTKIHRFLKKPVDIGALSDVEQWQKEYRQLDGKLSNWRYGLASEYGNTARFYDSAPPGSKIGNCVWIMLHIAYQTAIIRLHSSAAYPTTRSPIFTPSFSASQRCCSAVEEICVINSYARNNGLLDKLGPPFAFSLWVAARVLLVHASTIERSVNPAIRDLVDTLHELGVYWQVAQRYATLLSRVLQEYSEGENHHSTDNNRDDDAPSAVRILADMRRTAYDLDMLISRQPHRLPSHRGPAAPGESDPTNKDPSNPHLAENPPHDRFDPKTAQPTPARTPAPEHLEYLDVFDFFNLPRLVPTNGASHKPSVDATQQTFAAGDVGDAIGMADAADLVNGGVDDDADGSANTGRITSEFNITNFIYDINEDWFNPEIRYYGDAR